MTLESAIENPVVAIAERHGWIARKLQWVGRRGGMDRAFFKDGRCVFIEFKRPGKTLIGQQMKEFERIKAAYVDTHWCDSIEEALAILEIET